MCDNLSLCYFYLNYNMSQKKYYKISHMQWKVFYKISQNEHINNKYSSNPNA